MVSGEGPERRAARGWAARGRGAGLAEVGRLDVERGFVVRLRVGEVPDRPDPCRDRGGAGVRVAMVRRLPTSPPQASYATPVPLLSPGWGRADTGPVAMSRADAAQTLGVRATSGPDEVDRAFRAAVRRRHPDRYPAGSEAAEDATRDLLALLEARDVMGAQSPAPLVHDSETGAWVWLDDLPHRRDDEGFMAPEEADRRLRRRMLLWGAFLLLSAGIGTAIGTSSGHTDGLAIWAPTLVVIALISIGIGLAADRRLRRPR